MFNDNLKSTQPFATRFFESALNSENSKFAHAYMFTGRDSMAQYNLAIQIAKILNCKQRLSFSATKQSVGSVRICCKNNAQNACTNCNWIKQNRHPAVITISPIDYLYGNDGGKAKTEITIAQSRYLKQELSTASQYHRVIIFTDAEEGKEQERKAEALWKNYKGELNPPSLDMNEETRESWIPLPLTRKMFDAAAANALLKSIEEPFPNVTFFFLTKDKEDMIETIVSRTQVVPVLSENRESVDLSILENFFKVFPPKNYGEAISYSERLLEVAKENSCSEEELLVIMQEYMRRLLRANSQDKAISSKIIGNIEKIQQAQNQLTNYVNTQAVFDSLMVGMV